MARITRLLLATALVLPASSAVAQTASLAGVVVDARTGRALPGVRVSADSQPAAVTTDAEGRFSLDLTTGRHTLSVTLIGYALWRQPVDVLESGTPTLRIELAEGTGGVEEHVRVSAATQGDADRPPAAVTLHGRELQALRGITLDDPLRALHSLPSVAAPDDFYSEFAVRGLGFRNIGLAVDGMPSRFLMHAVHGITDGGSIAMINSDAVGSMSLLPGSYAQRFGPQIGSQVEIALRAGDRERFRARAGLSGTSATVLAEGPIAGSRGSWLVSGRRSYLDLLLERIDEDNSLAFGFSDALTKVVFDVSPRHQLQALAIVGASTFEEDPESLGPNDQARIDGRSWLSGLSWRYTPSARVAVTQRVYATGLAFDQTNPAGGVLDDSRATDAGWRVDASLAPHSGALVEIGGDARVATSRRAVQRSLNDAPTLTRLSDYRATGRAAAAYVQLALGPWRRVTITPGARVDYWSATDASTASPWLNANVAITDTTHVRAGTGVYRQFADLEQINGLRGGGSALRPETATHVDVEVTQRLPLAATLQIGWFTRADRDVLWTPGSEPRRLADGRVQLGLGNAPWTNALDGDARGVEVVVRRDAPTGLSGWVGYAYTRHRYDAASSGESFWADEDQRHGLSLFAHYRLSTRTTLGAKFRYGSNYPRAGYLRERTPGIDTPPLLGGGQPLFFELSDTRNALRLPAYARLDVRGDRTFTWGSRRLTLFVELANALDRSNLRNVPYDIDRTGRVFGGTDTLLPLLPSAGLVIEF